MSAYLNIPAEMRGYKQWICWRLEERPGAAKPTKAPYSPWPNAGMASVTKSETWGTFEQAIGAPNSYAEVCPWDYENNRPLYPVSQTGFSGVGYVITANDPYTIIDLDDTHGDVEAYERQIKVFQQFNSYTELSPSGKGCHIIVKGKTPQGRRRASIELYPGERYMTMTGNVIHNVPIAERQHLLDILFEQMGGDVRTYAVAEDKEQRLSDDEVVAQASAAVNGDKFKQLYTGDWQGLYASQSEADFALVDIIAFYTQNKAQIARVFRASALGQREKANRDKYIEYMVEKSFDRQLPPIDIDGFRQKLNALIAGDGGATGEPGGTPAAPNATAHHAAAGPHNAVAISAEAPAAVSPFPPGLLGEVAQFFLAAAPRPVPDIALAGAIAFMAGITGRAYNVSGTGLNQYIIMLAPTGVGKDAIADGTSKLMSAIGATVPSIIDFKGPGELVSSAGLIKWLDKKPCVISILGEIGKKLKEMASPHANSHLTGLSRVLLQMYSKSGYKSVFDPMAYSDKEKNTNPIYSPSLTIIGESVPEGFYESLDESLIADGLLPRFMVFEYKGERAYLNKKAKDVLPPFPLVQRLADLAASALTLQHQQTVHDVPLSPEAEAKFDEFDRYTTDLINKSGEVPRQLWNRAHLKALKLAALQAIGENPINPVIGLNTCMWATNIVVEQTTKLIAKFETGLVGQVGGSEARQIGEVIKVISTFLHNDYARYEKYGGSYEMHRDGVITEGHISRRLMCVACFKNDRIGPTAAIKRALKTLVEADELREMPKAQMQMSYGTGPRAFVASNPARFMPTKD